MKQNLPQFEYSDIFQQIEKSSLESSIYIGCDSKEMGDEIVYVAVIIIHYDSRHGAKIFKHYIIKDNQHDIKKKLMFEIETIVDVALKLQPIIGGRNFEVHVDLNPDSSSKNIFSSKPHSSKFNVLCIYVVINL